MISRFQNIHGVGYSISGRVKDIKQELKNLISGIIEDKKFPFTSVYVTLPLFLFPNFINELKISELKLKELENKKQTIMLKF